MFNPQGFSFDGPLLLCHGNINNYGEPFEAEARLFKH
jgi:hypothetical protein